MQKSELTEQLPNHFQALTPNYAEIEPPGGVVLLHLSPTIGTEVRGIPVGTLEDEHRAFLITLLRRRKVLFFRDQEITDDQQISFARTWGDVLTMPYTVRGGGVEDAQIYSLHSSGANTGAENLWHTDTSWLACPPSVTVLRSRIVPEIGGDTLFADMVAAFEGLPAAIQKLLEPLGAAHNVISSNIRHVDDRGRLASLFREVGPQVHPVVRVHKDTGRKALYCVRQNVTHIEGLPHTLSRELISFICAQAEQPEYQCRFRWTPNSVAVWDNAVVQHYAVSDYAPAERLMARVTITGERPIWPADV
jgi:taurine dioxygenase